MHLWCFFTPAQQHTRKERIKSFKNGSGQSCLLIFSKSNSIRHVSHSRDFSIVQSSGPDPYYHTSICFVRVGGSTPPTSAYLGSSNSISFRILLHSSLRRSCHMTNHKDFDCLLTGGPGVDWNGDGSSPGLNNYNFNAVFKWVDKIHFFILSMFLYFTLF